MSDNGQAGVAAYVSWSTFSNVLDALTQGIPNQIDRSVFPTQSGSQQTQLLTAFKFLGLTDEDGKPQPALEALAVRDEASRKKQTAKLLRDHYPELFALRLEKATPDELSKAVEAHYGVSGSTRDKAVRFFLGAAEFAGVTLSPLLAVKKRRGPARKRRATKVRSAGPTTDELTQNQVQPPNAGTVRVIRFENGGSISISESVQAMTLTPRDRKFIGALLELFDEYEQETARRVQGAEAQEGGEQ
jgi:hypothetical protein